MERKYNCMCSQCEHKREARIREDDELEKRVEALEKLLIEVLPALGKRIDRAELMGICF